MMKAASRPKTQTHCRSLDSSRFAGFARDDSLHSFGRWKAQWNPRLPTHPSSSRLPETRRAVRGEATSVGLALPSILAALQAPELRGMTLRRESVSAPRHDPGEKSGLAHGVSRRKVIENWKEEPRRGDRHRKICAGTHK